MALFSPPESSLGGTQLSSQARMVGGGSVLNPQGPEPGEKREYGVPAQGERIVHENLCSGKPRADSPDRLAQEGKRRLRRIQASAPSAQRRGIGHAIGVLYGGRRGFPGAAFQEPALQHLATGDKAVMAVGRRKGRQEGERLAAPVAKAATNPDPIMVLIVRLFAAAAMTNDGILSANRAMAQDDLHAGLGPIGIEVELRRREWDKQNRSNEAPPGLVILPGSQASARPFLLHKSHLEKNNAAAAAGCGEEPMK
jgi:hypothetical protein